MLAFPLLAYAENNLGSGTDDKASTPGAEQTATNRSAVGDAAAVGSVDSETENIPEEDTPLSKRSFELGWSLINLLASLASIIIGVALVTYSMLRRPRGELLNPGEPQLPQNFGLAVFGMLAAVISTVLFTSTADLSARMIVADSFTVVHIAILAISILCAVLTLKRDLGDPINLEK